MTFKILKLRVKFVIFALFQTEPTNFQSIIRALWFSADPFTENRNKNIVLVYTSVPPIITVNGSKNLFRLCGYARFSSISRSAVA